MTRAANPRRACGKRTASADPPVIAGPDGRERQRDARHAAGLRGGGHSLKATGRGGGHSLKATGTEIESTGPGANSSRPPFVPLGKRKTRSQLVGRLATR